MRRAIVFVVLLGAILATLTGTSGAAGAATVDFDTDPFGSRIVAPSIFKRTHPLGNLYAQFGVHFHGVKPRTGGAILNQRGGFGVDARSGRNFLAFNQNTYAKAPEVIEFDSLQGIVTVNAGYGLRSTFSMTGFRGDRTVDVVEVTVPGGTYGRLRIVADKGVDRVVIRPAGDRVAFVLDDLSFEPIRYS